MAQLSYPRYRFNFKNTHTVRSFCAFLRLLSRLPASIFLVFPPCSPSHNIRRRFALKLLHLINNFPRSDGRCSGEEKRPSISISRRRKIEAGKAKQKCIHSICFVELYFRSRSSAPPFSPTLSSYPRLINCQFFLHHRIELDLCCIKKGFGFIPCIKKKYVKRRG